MNPSPGFRTRLTQAAERNLLSWGLPDQVFVSVRDFLFRVLPTAPTQYLVRAQLPYEGMNCYYELLDPSNRMRLHRFVFHVVYGYDVGREQELLIVRHGTYFPVFGG